jgi:AcrR family transcriptional regulator
MADKRIRRTKKEIEKTLQTALENLIVKKGFDKITFNELAKDANVNPIVIYNRYNNLEDFFDKYIRKYDYWLSDIVKLDQNEDAKISLIRIFTDLIEDLYSNEIMQKILLWELGNHNEMTARMAINRELQSRHLFKYFDATLNDTVCELRPVTAILVAGIYYLILHRRLSTFSETDFNTEEGKELLIRTVSNMIDLLFITKGSETNDKKTLQIAKNLMENGVEMEIIARSTGLSNQDLEKLKKEVG